MSQIGLQVAARFHLPVDRARRILPLGSWPPAQAQEARAGGQADVDLHQLATLLFRLFRVPVHLERRWFELLSSHPGTLPHPRELDGYTRQLAGFLRFKGLPDAAARQSLSLIVSVTRGPPDPQPASPGEAGTPGRGAWGILNLGTDPAVLRVGLDPGGPQPGDRAIIVHPREGVAFPDHHALAIDGLWPLSGEPAVTAWLS